MSSQRILITGPESSGKSTLARQMAWALDGIYVAEYARRYLIAQQGAYEEGDLLHIARKQMQLEQAASRHDTLVFCDTGPFVLAVWSMVKYGRIAPEVQQLVQQADYDLILLCQTDLPWSYDPLREHPKPADREALYQRYVHYVTTSGLPFAIIKGEDRLQQGLAHINALRNG